MKGLRKYLDKNVKPLFEKGGKLERFWVVYDGLDTFMFVPGHATHRGAHIRDGIDLKRTMITVVLAMVPCLLFGMYNTGLQHYLASGMANPELMDCFLFGAMKVLPIVVVSYGVGLGIEFLFAGLRGHSINEGYLVSGMLIPLIMPADIPLWMVGLACAFAVIIGKEVFGGTGMNILNVALTARAFLFFAYPTMMSGDQVWFADEAFSGTVDAVSGATALGIAATDIPLADFTSQFTFMDSLIGNIPGSIGETSLIACVLGAFVLIYTGIGSWKVMLSAVIGGLSMAYIFNAFGANTLMQIDPLHQLALGGFAFGVVFMATDPVTAAQTNTGKYIYGFLVGFLAIMIRVFNPAYPEGMMLAILFMNVMAPLIDHFVLESNIKKRMKRAQVVA